MESVKAYCALGSGWCHCKVSGAKLWRGRWGIVQSRLPSSNLSRLPREGLAGVAPVQLMITLQAADLFTL